jgi:hypothetical protein
MVNCDTLYWPSIEQQFCYNLAEAGYHEDVGTSSHVPLRRIEVKVFTDAGFLQGPNPLESRGLLNLNKLFDLFENIRDVFSSELERLTLNFSWGYSFTTAEDL